jgi:hypothetical protein
MFSNIFPKIMPLEDDVEKYCEQTTDDRQYGACALHAG